VAGVTNEGSIYLIYNACNSYNSLILIVFKKNECFFNKKKMRG